MAQDVVSRPAVSGDCQSVFVVIEVVVVFEARGVPKVGEGFDGSLLGGGGNIGAEDGF